MWPSISPDGRFVTFTSTSTNLVTPSPVPAALVLTPERARRTVGTQHWVVAEVSDASGALLPAVQVGFAVSGRDTLTGSALTDTAGRAEFCFVVSELPGLDRITASFHRPAPLGAGSATSAPSPPSGRAIFEGITLSAGTNARGDQRFWELSRSGTRIDAFDVDALNCSAGAASIFGEARNQVGASTGFRIDLIDRASDSARGRYRIRLTDGFDSGDLPVRSGFIDIDM